MDRLISCCWPPRLLGLNGARRDVLTRRKSAGTEKGPYVTYDLRQPLQFLTRKKPAGKLAAMKAIFRARPIHSWLLILATMLLVVGNLCEFVGEAQGHALIGAHERNAPAEDHHHSSAHLASCENGAVPTSSSLLVSPDIVTPPPSVEVLLIPLQVQSVAVCRLPDSFSGPPLFILHATLLI